MAQFFLSLNRGQQKDGDVAVATAAPAAGIYVQINTATAPTRKDVVLALKVIVRYLLSNGLPGGNANIGVDLPPL